MCELAFDDPCAVWRESTRVARKPHRCDCCHQAIQPGQKYLSHFSVFEGDATSQCLCLRCDAFRQEFAAAHDDATPSPSYFLSVLSECVADGDEESERRWKPMLEALEAAAHA